MGSGKIISYQNNEEAAEVLMERNMPDVLHNRQTEAHLPKIPRVVDVEKYVVNKKSLAERDLSFLGIKKGTEDIANALGDIAERDLSQELKKFFAKPGGKNVVILQGGNFRVPGKSKGAIEEHDFIIIDMEHKLIICIESKVTLTGSTGHSAVEQTKKLQSLLEEYFASELTSSQWCFVPMIFTEIVNTKQQICPECLPFIIQGTSQVATKLNGLRALFLKVRTQPVIPSHREYVSLVRGLAFVVLSQPIGTHCTIVSNIYNKVEGKPAKGKAKAKAGQGDFQSILFWTTEQAKIMLWVIRAF